MLFSRLHLDPGETVVLEVRKHWFVFIGYVIGSILAALVPVALFAGFEFLVPEKLLVIVNSHITIAVFAYLIWLLMVWTVFFVQWTNYYLDVWYITEKRIIDVNQKGLFHREVSNLRFDKIQDISIEVKGMLATFLNFGDLQVQTAAEDSSEFRMKMTRAPERVREVIFSRHNKEAEKVKQPSQFPDV